MQLKKNKNVVKYRKPMNFNIGVIIFVIIFIYLVFNVFSYLTETHISVYEVREGSILKDNSYTGLAIRNETVIRSEDNGYVNYFVSAGSKVGAKTQIYSLSDHKLQFESKSGKSQKLTSVEQNNIRQKTQTSAKIILMKVSEMYIH